MIGCDIVKNSRLINKSKRFIEFILSQNELLENNHKLYLAGRFAAKEAVMKVLANTKELSFLDIEILNNESGKPICNIKDIDVSISHEDEYTVAVAIKKTI